MCGENPRYVCSWLKADIRRAALAHQGPTLVDVTIDPSGYGAQLAALRG